VGDVPFHEFAQHSMRLLLHPVTNPQTHIIQCGLCAPKAFRGARRPSLIWIASLLLQSPRCNGRADLRTKECTSVSTSTAMPLEGGSDSK
jgi:hypothetical protein